MADDLALSSTAVEGQGTDGVRALAGWGPDDVSLRRMRIDVEESERLKSACQRGLDRWYVKHIELMNVRQTQLMDWMVAGFPTSFSHWPQRANAGSPNPSTTAERSANT